jgi:hypothetical protein
LREVWADGGVVSTASLAVLGPPRSSLLYYPCEKFPTAMR